MRAGAALATLRPLWRPTTDPSAVVADAPLRGWREDVFKSGVIAVAVQLAWPKLSMMFHDLDQIVSILRLYNARLINPLLFAPVPRLMRCNHQP